MVLVEALTNPSFVTNTLLQPDTGSIKRDDPLFTNRHVAT